MWLYISVFKSESVVLHTIIFLFCIISMWYIVEEVKLMQSHDKLLSFTMSRRFSKSHLSGGVFIRVWVLEIGIPNTKISGKDTKKRSIWKVFFGASVYFAPERAYISMATVGFSIFNLHFRKAFYNFSPCVLGIVDG